MVYEEDVCNKVAKAVSSLVREITTFSEKSLKTLEQCFKTASIGFKAGHLEIKLELEKVSKEPVQQLEDLLDGLEKLAEKHKKSLVLFFDEFQDVLKVDETNKIQAAIRAVAQHSKYVTYIFSGSSRMMLNKIFDDKNQPLYMLCDKIILKRIEASHFKMHIQKAAQKKWKTNLSDALLASIFLKTECHSYYINMLCNKLWDNEQTPTEQDIEKSWDTALFENKGKIIADLESLNSSRMKVITMVALMEKVNEPIAKLFLIKLNCHSQQRKMLFLT